MRNNVFGEVCHSTLTLITTALHVYKQQQQIAATHDLCVLIPAYEQHTLRHALFFGKSASDLS
jgi:hypothetical protein